MYLTRMQKQAMVELCTLMLYSMNRISKKRYTQSTSTFDNKKPMKLNLEKMNGCSVIFIQEERIDAHNSGELKEYILHLIEHGEVNIIVQLENVRFIDSSGLGALLSGYKNAAAKSGKLALACCKQQVLSMFELTRLNRVFEIYTDLNEAFENET
jgi:anti-sigma B factor antagonist